GPHRDPGARAVPGGGLLRGLASRGPRGAVAAAGGHRLHRARPVRGRPAATRRRGLGGRAGGGAVCHPIPAAGPCRRRPGRPQGSSCRPRVGWWPGARPGGRPRPGGGPARARRLRRRAGRCAAAPPASGELGRGAGGAGRGGGGGRVRRPRRGPRAGPGGTAGRGGRGVRPRLRQRVASHRAAPSRGARGSPRKRRRGPRKTSGGHAPTQKDHLMNRGIWILRGAVALVAVSAFVAIWGGWVGLGRLAGFGPVDLLPGVPGGPYEVDLSITLPLGVEAFAAIALYVAVSGLVEGGARTFAWVAAIGSLGLGMFGQAAYHLLTAQEHGAGTPTWVVVFVSVLPVLVLGLASLLLHLAEAGARQSLALGVAGAVPALTEPDDDGPG